MGEPESNRHASRLGIIVTAVIIVLMLPFLPLLCAVVEHTVFGTRHVEDFFERVGLHDKLGELYHFVFRLFGGP
jgi:hypothetical protein